MKILAGGPVRQHPAVLKAHLETMLNQDLPEGVEVDYRYINDLHMDDQDYTEARDVLYDTYPDKIQVISSDFAERPPGATYGVSEDTHHWAEPTFEYLGSIKDRLLHQAVSGGYDAVWLVDTDLLVGPGTLRSLINSGKPVTSAVFWTAWSQGSPVLPQVWQRHPYELDGGRTKHIHTFLNKIAQRQLINVGGLGACTLISTEAIKSGLTFTPFVPGLPRDGMWQGEDRHFCVKAQRLHIPLFADAWPDVFHVYRPSDRENMEKAMISLGGRRKPTPELGDLVSFTVEPLTVPRLAGFKLHVRGRLGSLKLLPELEQDLRDLAVGEEILTQLYYPGWFEVPEFQYKTSTVRVKLLDCKYYLPHVGLPFVESSYQDSFYSPHQLTAMGRSAIHAPRHGAGDQDE